MKRIPKIIYLSVILIFLFVQFNQSYSKNKSSNNRNLVLSSHKSFNSSSDILLKDTLVVLPLGNSITFDKRTNDPRVDGDKFGYRLPLANLFNEAGITFDYIGSEQSGWNFLADGLEDNAGFPGIKDDQITTLLETGWRVQPPNFNEQITFGPYLETYTPDVILLHIGTNGNDLAGGTSASDIENILDEIDRVENLLDKDIFVFVARIIDRAPTQSYVNEFNTNVDSMVTDRITNPENEAYPDNIQIVDMEDGANIIYSIDSMGTIGNGIIGDMNDQLHPNDKGFLKIAQNWFSSFNEVFPNPMVITEQPNNIGTIVGFSADFSILVESDQDVSYQWIKNGEIVPGATDSVFSLESLTLADDNSKVSCIIKSGFYTLFSDTAIVSVTDTNVKVLDGLIANYDFEEAKGDTIKNKIVDLSSLDLFITDSSAIDWIPYGLKITDETNISTLLPAVDIYNSILETNEISIEAWIEPVNENQSGPARIITFSDGISNRNFTLGQSNDQFEVRFRTSESDNNGKPSLKSTNNSASNNLTHIFYSRDKNGLAKLYINGELDTTFTLSGDLSNWDSSYFFGISNEFFDDRVWLGKYYLLSLYNRALSNEEIVNNYNAEFNGFNNLLEIPTNLDAVLQNETDVLLTWDDNSEDELGYIIERKFNHVDSLFIVLDTTLTNVTSYLDSVIKLDSSYIYRLKAYNETYFSDYSNELIVNDIPVSVEESVNLVNDYKLFQNYPNPFNPSTTIKYSLPKKSKIELAIFNSLGEIVKIIQKDIIRSNGLYSEIFDGSGLASGIYFYRIIAEPIDGSAPFIKTNKAILVK